MLGLSRRALYRRLERLDLSGTISRRRHIGLPRGLITMDVRGALASQPPTPSASKRSARSSSSTTSRASATSCGAGSSRAATPWRVAGDADEALQRLAQAPAAVVVCDLRMPGQGGLWLTDLLRREFPDTAVIIATGVSDVAAAVEGLRQGVVDYLTKPFDRERLFDAVARASTGIAPPPTSASWRESLEAEMRGRAVTAGGRARRAGTSTPTGRSTACSRR